jgi:hypothetical protein
VVDKEAGTKEEEVEREVEKAVDGSGEREGVEKTKVVENAIVVEENGSSSGRFQKRLWRPVSKSEVLLVIDPQV